MRQRQHHHRPRPTAVSALLLLGAASLLTTPSAAVPYPKDDLHAAGFGYLQPRQCAQYCGYQNQYCCSAGTTCTTSAGIALCANGGDGGGGWAFYTTTWTLTETFTSTISSPLPASTTAAAGGGGAPDCVPVAGSGQIACGAICCASDQYCAWRGQCLPNVAGAGGGGGSGATVTTVITTGGQTITTQYSAPYRVTSDATVTQTSSAGTGTLASQTSTSSSGNGTVVAGGTAGHLSPGAIAGIVIGVLAGVALLLLVCACFLVRGLWHGLLALLGLGSGSRKRNSGRRTETIVEEERYSRHGHSRPPSVHSRRDTHGGWFGGGGRPSNVSGRKEKKKSGGGFGWLGLTAAAGTLLLLLGLRRDRKRQNRPAKTRSDVSSSYFGSDSYTVSSPSSASTRRTRESRHSRATRTTRHSRPSSVRP